MWIDYRLEIGHFRLGIHVNHWRNQNPSSTRAWYSNKLSDHEANQTQPKLTKPNRS